MDFDLKRDFVVLDAAINRRFPRQPTPDQVVTETPRMALRLLRTLTYKKAEQVCALQLQYHWRVDRSCTVKDALRSDLETIARYLDGPASHELTPATIEKWTVALIWPLNRAIHASPHIRTHEVSAALLLDGLTFRGVEAFVRAGPKTIYLTSLFLRELLWTNLTVAMDALRLAMSGKPATVCAPVQRLLIFLENQLRLRTHRDLPERDISIAVVSELDAALEQPHWARISWPIIPDGRMPSTYAQWLSLGLDAIARILRAAGPINKMLVKLASENCQHIIKFGQLEWALLASHGVHAALYSVNQPSLGHSEWSRQSRIYDRRA
ncbi:hypothetical protein JCM10908_001469 [Rhodotorula pacifica]|uniref:uncharacterized protein n=1 Tax=Rhodotorula pacifica TaxID=1495444 RepID=UPI003179E207